jgi:hypothetical protein
MVGRRVYKGVLEIVSNFILVITKSDWSEVVECGIYRFDTRFVKKVWTGPGKDGGGCIVAGSICAIIVVVVVVVVIIIILVVLVVLVVLKEVLLLLDVTLNRIRIFFCIIVFFFSVGMFLVGILSVGLCIDVAFKVPELTRAEGVVFLGNMMAIRDSQNNGQKIEVLG